MNKNSTTYSFVFALIVCIVCSFLLALVSEGLRPRKEFNEDVERRKNILKVVGLQTAMDGVRSLEEIAMLYQEKIQERVIDSQGNFVPDKTPDHILAGEAFYPLYIYEDEGGAAAYVFPVYGQGLWSTIYGYLALEPDGITIKNISFYKHGETPGLGGEVQAPWFERNFQGKKIYDVTSRTLRPPEVARGKAAELYSGRDLDFAVDGISGATMTGKGVTQFLDKQIRIYEPYFKKVRK